jgi:hypothetical protein
VLSLSDERFHFREPIIGICCTLFTGRMVAAVQLLFPVRSTSLENSVEFGNYQMTVQVRLLLLQSFASKRWLTLSNIAFVLTLSLLLLGP